MLPYPPMVNVTTLLMPTTIPLMNPTTIPLMNLTTLLMPFQLPTLQTIQEAKEEKGMRVFGADLANGRSVKNSNNSEVFKKHR